MTRKTFTFHHGPRARSDTYSESLALIKTPTCPYTDSTNSILTTASGNNTLSSTKVPVNPVPPIVQTLLNTSIPTGLAPSTDTINRSHGAQEAVTIDSMPPVVVACTD